MRCVAIGLIVLALAGCNREKTDLRPYPSIVAIDGNSASESLLQPGGAQSVKTVSNPDHGNAYDIAEGQRLFNWYNCSGCHANGGGGIGPPLIKTEWIYGGEPANIYDTIVKGRPNGMPTWGNRIPEYQIWQIVAYVRSLNNLQPNAATAVRADTIETDPRTVHQPVIPPVGGPSQ